MEIVTFLNGIVARYINQDEFLPLGQNSLWMFVPGIAEQYDFKSVGQGAQGGVPVGDEPVLQNGSFTIDGQVIPIIELRLQTGRIVVNCSKTEQAEAFHRDLERFLIDHHKFRSVSREVPLAYASSLVVKSEGDIVGKIEIFRKMSSIISNGFNRSGQAGSLFPQSLKFSGTTKLGDGVQMSSFVVEERAGRPSGSGWVYTQASLTTEMHIEVLEALDLLTEGEATDA
ncbi:MAG: hypothetical protein ACRYGP_01995 [Janthinobacterium lividum]